MASPVMLFAGDVALSKSSAHLLLRWRFRACQSAVLYSGRTTPTRQDLCHTPSSRQLATVCSVRSLLTSAPRRLRCRHLRVEARSSTCSVLRPSDSAFTAVQRSMCASLLCVSVSECGRAPTEPAGGPALPLISSCPAPPPPLVSAATGRRPPGADNVFYSLSRVSSPPTGHSA